MSQADQLPADLREKVALLKASPHFDTINEGSARYVNKQEMLLVLTGKKPVAEVVSSIYATIPGGRRSAPDDEGQVAELLKGLGLAYRLWSDENVTMAVVSLDSRLVAEYMRSLGHGHGNIGRLFGYPATAVDAFDTDRALTFEEQDRVMAAAGLPEFMPQFRMSRAHASDEIKVLEDWQQTIAAYGLDRP